MRKDFKNLDIYAAFKPANGAEWQKANGIHADWKTPEHIEVKPVYTKEDLEGMEHLGYAAGLPPYLRLWGVGDLSKLVYAAKKIYDSHRGDLERERTDEEFMAMYEQYEAFDELEDEFLEKEEEYTALVAGYVDEHLELFAKIV